MIEGIIHSENPEQHWEHIKAEGKTILDLGCGFWTEEERQKGDGTAKYFIGQNPTKYIGLDINAQDIQRLAVEFPQAVFIAAPIRSPADILELLDKFKPQVIKCDIEGMEIALLGLKDRQGIEQIAIESHYNNEGLLIEWMSRVRLNPWRIDKVSFCSQIKVLYGKC